MHINLIFVALGSSTALAAFLNGLSADLFVVLLEGSQVLTGLGELFLHALADLAYIKSNLCSRRENTSATAVVLEIMHKARCTLARSPPGTTVGGW